MGKIPGMERPSSCRFRYLVGLMNMVILSGLRTSGLTNCRIHAWDEKDWLTTWDDRSLWLGWDPGSDMFRLDESNDTIPFYSLLHCILM